MARVLLCAATAMLSTAILAAPAWAQEIPENQDVADRSHAEYDQIGVNVGGFKLLPAMTTTVAATSNYWATNTNKHANVGLFLRPDLTWTSNWARHRIDGNAFVEQRLNAPLHTANTLNYGARISGVYDRSHDTNLRVSARAERQTEDPQSLNRFQDFSGPVHYNLLQADATLSHSLASLRLRVNGNAQRLTYEDIRQTNHQLLDQSFRDYVSLSAGGSAEYDFNNGIGVIVSGQHDRSRYDFGPGSAGFIPGVSLDRDSSGNNLQAGVTLELSSLIFGTIQAGYLTRTFVDPRLKDVSSPSFSANLLWNATPLTSFRLIARKWVEESASSASAGNLRTDIGLQVHHELYRNLLLSARLNASRFTPLLEGKSGMEESARLDARYLMNRHLTLTANVRYARRSGGNEFIRYDAVEGRVALRYGL